MIFNDNFGVYNAYSVNQIEQGKINAKIKVNKKSKVVDKSVKRM